MPEERKPADSPRELILDFLLDKVAQDRFPSLSELDMIESLLRPHEVEIYVRLLLRGMREERYPSIPILRRIAALTE